MASVEFSTACERNKEPILTILREWFARCRCVLEIGSGTGQHAVWFARHLPHLRWTPSDREQYLPALRARLAAEAPDNVDAPVCLDVTGTAWPMDGTAFDAVFTANTLHIMSWTAVERLFAGLDDVLGQDGLLAVYGPFRYAGAQTAPSNDRFDRMLRDRDPDSGIRDYEAVDALARAAGLELLADRQMPANNQLIAWRRAGSQPLRPLDSSA